MRRRCSLPYSSLLSTVKRHKLLKYLCATAADSHRTQALMQERILLQLAGTDHQALAAYFAVLARIHQLAGDAAEQQRNEQHRTTILALAEKKYGKWRFLVYLSFSAKSVAEVDYKLLLGATSDDEYVKHACRVMTDETCAELAVLLAAASADGARQVTAEQLHAAYVVQRFCNEMAVVSDTQDARHV